MQSNSRKADLTGQFLSTDMNGVHLLMQECKTMCEMSCPNPLTRNFFKTLYPFSLFGCSFVALWLVKSYNFTLEHRVSYAEAKFFFDPFLF